MDDYLDYIQMTENIIWKLGTQVSEMLLNTFIFNF